MTSRPTALSKHVERINHWRDAYNPLRGLNLRRAVDLIESYPRGDYADLMWTLGAPFVGIESADADLLTLVERRGGAVSEMDWTIRVIATEDGALAEAQSDYLRSAYEKITNLYAAIEHLSLATFRGFSHCEIIRDNTGAITELSCVPQWNIVRDGSAGEWKFNPNADSVSFDSLPKDYILDKKNWLINEVSRPIGRIALVKWIRENLSEKDWDAFIEIYGVPGGVIIGPPDMPQDKEDEFRSAAEGLARGGSGVLPNGSSYIPNDSPRGVNPFRDRLAYLQEKLILAGTGGLLTSLARASGLGSGAADAQADVFATLARKDARKISELFQRTIDAALLSERFPGKPILAYFSLAADDSENVAQYIDNIAKLATAGYISDASDVSERTGYALSYQPPAPVTPMPFANSRREVEMNSEAANRALEAAQNEDLKPMRDAVKAFLSKFENGTATENDVPEIDAVFSADATANAWSDGLSDAVANGIATALQAEEKAAAPLSNAGDVSDQPREDDGKFASKGEIPTAPKRITEIEANVRLLKGEKVTSADGKTVNFGKRLKQKLESKPEYDGRKELLDWGEEAVRSGKHVKDNNNPKKEVRDFYAKVFHEDSKDKGVLVIVDAADGEAFNIYSTRTSYLKKKGLANKRDLKRARPDALPSAGVIRAIVAENRTADCQ